MYEEEQENALLKNTYDFDVHASLVAAEKGLEVVLPKPNELQIDIDSEEQFREFWRRFECFRIRCGLFYDMSKDVRVTPSPSGLPNRHITIELPREITEVERILLQAALGDDPLRVFLNAMRFFAGCPNPSRLFEKPKHE